MEKNWTDFNQQLNTTPEPLEQKKNHTPKE